MVALLGGGGNIRRWGLLEEVGHSGCAFERYLVSVILFASQSPGSNSLL
jgi:hypothetical protein